MTSLQYRIFLFVKLVPLCLIWFLVCLLESFHVLSTSVSHTLGGRDSRRPLPPSENSAGVGPHTPGACRPACLGSACQSAPAGGGALGAQGPQERGGLPLRPPPHPPAVFWGTMYGCCLVYGWFTGENKNQGLELSAVGSNGNRLGLFYGHFQVQPGSWVKCLPSATQTCGS